MKRKVFNYDNLILFIFIVGMIAVASIALSIGTKDEVYGAPANLEGQNTEINSFMKFDAGFGSNYVISSHSVTEDINPEWGALNLQVYLAAGSTFSNGQIQFFDANNGNDVNFNIKYDSQNNFTRGGNEATKTLYMNTISAPSDQNQTSTLACSYWLDIGDNYNVSKLSEVSSAVITGTLYTSDGAAMTIRHQIYFQLNWQMKVPLTMDIAQRVSKYTKNDSDKTVTLAIEISNKINSTNRNTLPVKQNQITITKPTYQGVSPTSVKVTAKKTMATNGKDETTVGKANYSDNGNTVVITTTNPLSGNKAVCKPGGVDTYEVEYTYPLAAYNNFVASGISVNQPVSAVMALYTGTSTSTNVTGNLAGTINLTGQVGGDIYYRQKLPEYINALYKDQGGMYISSSYQGVTLRVEEMGNICSYKWEFGGRKLVINGTEYPAYINGVNYLPYEDVMIETTSFVDFLGSAGQAIVYDQNHSPLGTITTQSTTKQFGGETYYNLNISKEKAQATNSITVETSEPQGNLRELVIMLHQVHYEFPTFTVQQIQQLTEIYSMATLYAAHSTDPSTWIIDDEPPLKMELFYNDTYTDASVTVETATLDASKASQFQEMKLKIVMDNISEYSDAWSTPYFDIELPAEIIDIERQLRINWVRIHEGTQVQDMDIVENGLTLIDTKDGKLHLAIQTVGMQARIYSSKPYIEISMNVKVNKYAANVTRDVNVYYINNAVKTYKNPSTWPITPNTVANGNGQFPILANGTKAGKATGQVQFITDANLLCVSELSGYDGAKSINSMEHPNQTESIGRGTSPKPAMTLIIQNNHTVPVQNVVAIGRIPYTGNKGAISNVNLGTDINTALVSQIVNIGNTLPAGSYTIYYSDNINATSDLNAAGNNWVTSPGNYSTVRSFMIVINSALDVGQQVKFAYNFSVPATQYFNKSLYGNFGAYYTVNGGQRTNEAAKIGLTTGEGPIIEAIKTSNIQSGKSVKEGDIITYTITVTNKGKAEATNVVLTDNIPANTIYATVDAQGNITLNPSKKSITENIGTLAANASKQITFSVMVDDIKANTKIENIATVKADGVPDEQSTPTSIDAVTSSPKISIIKTSDVPEGGVVKEGDKIKFIIIVKNDGDGVARNVTIHDVIPKNTTYIDPNTGKKDPEKVKIDSPTKDILKPGEEYRLEITVEVDPINEKTDIENIATVTYDGDQTKSSDPVKLPAVTTEPYLKVDKEVSVSADTKVKEGDKITYKITVTNIGYGEAHNVQIKDTVPEGTIYYDEETKTTKPDVKNVESKKQATLEPQKSFTYSFVVQVGRIPAGTRIKNTAQAMGDDVPETKSNTVGTDADPTTPSLRAEKKSSIADGASVKEGDIITYTITVYNDGKTPAYNVTINDTVPEFTCYYENGKKDMSKKNVGKSIATLNAGASESYSFSVIVLEIPQNAQIKNTAKVTAENSPDIPTNTVGIGAETTVPSLEVKKISSISQGATVKPGDIITYTITVTNKGKAPAHNVVITDTVPANTTYVETTGNQYVKDPNRKTITKTIAELAAGESQSLSFSVMVNTLNSNIQISNTAKVTANNSPEIPSNTVGISAKPKDGGGGGELPYTGNIPLLIVFTFATISISTFAVIQYRSLKKRR